MCTNISAREFQTEVNEKLIADGLPDAELIDAEMAATYIVSGYTEQGAVDDVIRTWRLMQ